MENYKKMVEEVREAMEAVKNGNLSESSFIFVVAMIVNPSIINEYDLSWARKEIKKLT